MSRAVRRQKTVAPKERQPGRGSPFGGGRQQPTRGQRQAVGPRRRFHLGQPRWFEETISELRKVTWPTRDETVYLATVVIIVALVVGAALGFIDIFFNWLIDKLLLR
jgi:preprotein translocase subunit SecE